MIAKLLSENHSEFLSLKGGCTVSSESTLVKMPISIVTYSAGLEVYMCVSTKTS